MIRPMMQFFVVLVAVIGIGGRASAQTFTITSVDTVNLDKVAAGSVGETAFRLDPATGNVTAVSGSGGRLAATSARSLVTIACGNNGACTRNPALITITTIGTPTNRAAALRNFTVSTVGATASIGTPPGTGSTINFTLQPGQPNSSQTFWVGFDFPIKGDDSGALTGVSSSQFLVTVTNINGTRSDSRTGTANANVIRGLAIAKSTDLNFGRFFSPTSGSGLVSLNHTSGQVTVSGTGTVALPATTPTAAQFAVSGEGGQSVSVSIPPSFTMTGPSGAIQVATSANVSGAQTLSGTAGSLGALAIKVGGTYPVSASTPPGTYSGTFAVVVQYN